MLNKCILVSLLFVFVCLVISVSPSAHGKSPAFILNDIRFFESGQNSPEPSQRDYSWYFAMTTSRFINTDIFCKNILYNKKKHVHEVIVQYYDSAGNLLGDTKGSMVVEPEWEYFGYSTGGIGLDQKGNWEEGTYTVHVFIDGEKMGQEEFEILNDVDFGVYEAGRKLLGDEDDVLPFWF